MKPRGVIAAGHPKTAEAAADVLADGGNAFDAALAALCAACVTEPVLASLGGGGFLLARPARGPVVLYDFFTQTPVAPRPAAETDFYATQADFGPALQEFHIGLGSIATPGVVKGLFAVHRDLGSMPFSRLVAPAVSMARDGVELAPLQAFILSIVGAIFSATPASRAMFASRRREGALLQEGELHRVPDLADTFEALAKDGEALFYEGEIARKILDDCRERGGHLTAKDLAQYAVVKREPLIRTYRGARLALNPPPSSGGVLIAFALALLDDADLPANGFGDAGTLELLARVMAETNRARVESRLADLPADEAAGRLLDPDLLAGYKQQVLGRPACTRGTTHINVVDAHGNAAALSVSNGEGSAYIVPGTGVMLNNMLGEEDVNPQGFHRWPANRRMSSMMAPTMVFGADGRTYVLGSGGSNRIRTAILQVLVNLLDFGMTLDEAVEAPRIHFEDGLLNIEHGFAGPEVAALVRAFPRHEPWPTTNMFFGGVHVAMAGAGGRALGGVGDPRRGGVAIVT